MLRTRTYLVVLLAKSVWKVLRVRGYGGSTLPGYIVERFGRAVTKQVLSLLPEQVIIVCGTNGKTTTTKMISDVLRLRGHSVFTNAAGSNFTRGVIAEIIASLSWRPSKLKHDFAVLELDEAYGIVFVEYVQPTYVVALNVFRDQLDRFGELDRTAALLKSIMLQATTGCVVNGNEPLLVVNARQLGVDTRYYAVSDDLRWLFPTDDELLRLQPNEARREHLPVAVELVGIDRQSARYRVGDEILEASFLLRGIYNFENAAAAMTLYGMIFPDARPDILLKQLAQVSPAFGRGEIVQIDGRQLELILVKNPAGFQQALVSYDEPADVMIAINDNYADGRDVSWLWDVDFGLLKSTSIITAGSRAFDMALRLSYENLECDVCENLPRALRTLLGSNTAGMRIFCNYTAMLQIRAQLGRKAKLERLI